MVTGESASDISAERLPWKELVGRADEGESAAKEEADEAKEVEVAFDEEESVEKASEKADERPRWRGRLEDGDDER